MFNIYVNNIQCMAGAFAIFGYFKSITVNKGKVSNFISWISDGTPGVYILLAMNSPDGRLWWVDALKIDIWIYGDKLLPKIYLLCLLLFFIVVCIDHVRIFLVDKLMENKMIVRACKLFDDFYVINERS